MNTKYFYAFSLIVSSLLSASLSAATVQSWDFNSGVQGWTLSHMAVNTHNIQAASYSLTASGGALSVADSNAVLASLYLDPGALFFKMPTVSLADYEGGALSFDIRAASLNRSGVQIDLYTSNNDFVMLVGDLNGTPTFIAASIPYAKNGISSSKEITLSASSFNTGYQYTGGILSLLFGGNGSASGSSLSSTDFSDFLQGAELYIGSYNAALGASILSLAVVNSSTSFIDNVTLAPVPETSSYAAVFSSLLFGFVFLRRRRR